MSRFPIPLFSRGRATRRAERRSRRATHGPGLAALEHLEARVLLSVRTWTGLGPDNNWTTPANWIGGMAPVPGDDLVFPANVSRFTANNDFAAGTPFGSITLRNSGVSPYSLVGNALTLAGGISDQSTNTASNGIDFAGITLGASQTFFFQNPNGGLVFQTPINLQSFTLTLDGAASTPLQGAHFSRTISGDGGLVKNGTGEWFLDADNTYNGTTNVNAGRLVVSASSGLGSTAGGTVVNVGGNLSLESNPNPITVNEPLTLNGDGVPGDATGRGALALAASLSPVVVAGPIALGSASGIFASGDPSNSVNQLFLQGTINTQGNNLTLEGPLTTIVQGAVTGSGQVLQQSSQSLAGTGTIAGPLTVSSGALVPGTLATDNSVTPGVLSGGQVTLPSGSTFRVQINGTQAGGGNGYSQLSTAGPVNLNGSALSVTLGSGFVPAPDADFTIIQSNGAVSGTFAGLPNGKSINVNGQQFIIHYESSRVVLCAGPVNTAVALSASATQASVGQSVTFTAKVMDECDVAAPAPVGAGSVVFSEGSRVLAALPATGGTATFTTSTLATGTHTITASFNAIPGLYFGSQGSVNVIVSPSTGGGTTPGGGNRLAAVDTPSGQVVFAVRDDGGFFQKNTQGNSAWTPVGNFIVSISAVADGSGTPVVYATTQGNDLFRYDPVHGFQNLNSRFILAISAVEDASGNAVVFAVTQAHDLLLFNPTAGWINLNSHFIDSISAVRESSGQPAVYAVTQSHDLLLFDQTRGWQNLNSHFITAISAVTAANGVPAVYATTQGQDLLYFDPTQGWQNLNSRFIQALSAGTDAAGLPELYAITSANDVARNNAQRAWSILRPPERTMAIQGLSGDRLLARGTDGAILEFQASSGWMNLGVPASGV